MGLDAESTDLTARIRRRRAALVAAGQVDPARPGEHRAFRGQPGAAPPREMPERTGRHRVVPVDESPERGGLTAAEEAEKAADPEAEHDRPENPEVEYDPDFDPELASPETAALQAQQTADVNEFGEEFSEDDDGGFDLGDARPIAAMTPVTAEELDAASGPPVTIEEIAEIQSRPEALTQAKRKRTGTRRTALSVLDAYALDHSQRLKKIETITLAVAYDQRTLFDRVNQVDERLVGIEEGLLLLAEAVAQQGKDDASDTPQQSDVIDWYRPRPAFEVGDETETLDAAVESRPGLLRRLFFR